MGYLIGIPAALLILGVAALIAILTTGRAKPDARNQEDANPDSENSGDDGRPGR